MSKKRSQRSRGRRFWYTAVGLFFLLFIAALAASLFPVETTLDVTCETETITVRVPAGITGAWYFRNAIIAPEQTIESHRFTGAVRYRGPATVEVQRIGMGPLLLSLHYPEEAPDTTFFYEDGSAHPRAIAGPVSIRIRDVAARAEEGESIVLYLQGETVVGALKMFNPHPYTPILRSCSVDIISTAILTGRKFLGASYHVSPGEQLSFVSVPEPSEARTILFLDESSAMRASIRAHVKSAKVDRLGVRGYRLELPFLDRFRNDPLLIGMWTVGAFGVGVLLGLRR